MQSTASPVIVYSTSWCVFCRMAKQYFDSLKVSYKEVDVEHDRDAARELAQKTGQAGVPVIEIAGETILGFDRQKIDKALRANKLLK